MKAAVGFSGLGVEALAFQRIVADLRNGQRHEISDKPMEYQPEVPNFSQN